jgi:hypothetical protein
MRVHERLLPQKTETTKKVESFHGVSQEHIFPGGNNALLWLITVDNCPGRFTNVDGSLILYLK